MAYYHQPTQSRYGQCDSYWVESQDDGIYAMRADARERHRGIAKMQQRAIGEELSRLTADEYQEDVMEHMMHMEVSTCTWPPTGILTPLVTNTARCQFNRHPNGDPVVHAALPPRLSR
jgi:hypothetical protein